MIRQRESQKWGVPNWGTFEMSKVMRILPILNNPFEITKFPIIKIWITQFDNRISDYVSFIRFVSYSNDRWGLIDKRVLRLFYNRNIWINFWLFVQKKIVKGTSLSGFLTKSAWTTTTCCQTIWNKCVWWLVLSIKSQTCLTNFESYSYQCNNVHQFHVVFGYDLLQLFWHSRTESHTVKPIQGNKLFFISNKN